MRNRQETNPTGVILLGNRILAVVSRYRAFICAEIGFGGPLGTRGLIKRRRPPVHYLNGNTKETVKMLLLLPHNLTFAFLGLNKAITVKDIFRANSNFK